jgi:hypothetical protein
MELLCMQHLIGLRRPNPVIGLLDGASMGQILAVCINPDSSCANPIAGDEKRYIW